MAWRAVNSILILRDQANELAPDRATDADGTLCDQNHPTTSDHCPHAVAGLGSQIVTALDLTHDPTGGFDSYLFAEVLRVHRDSRIKYVISNHRMFSSYTTSSYPAWTWRPYSGIDPHTNHVHISVLDATISDTSTRWNLEGFDDMEQKDLLIRKTSNSNRTIGDLYFDLSNQRDWETAPETGGTPAPVNPPASNSRVALLHQRTKDTAANVAALQSKVAALESKLDQILEKLSQPVVLPVASSTFSSSGTVTWNPTE